jgi:predicted glycogen debranching enzyme
MTFELDVWLAGQVGEMVELPFFDARSISASDEREWLVCNGLGSFASGSISGANTRRYHGLLTAALIPPTTRTLMLSRIDEHVGGENVSTNIWGPDNVSPHGYQKIVAFSISPCPTWVYELPTGFLVKQVFMLPGKQASYIGYSWQSKPGESDSQTLDLHVLANFRSFHAETHGDDSWMFQQEQMPGGVTLKAYDTANPLHIQFTSGEWLQEPSWYKGYFYPREFERGLDNREDAFHAGVLRCTLKNGESTLILASLERTDFLPNLSDAVKELLKHRESILAQAGSPRHPAMKRLVLAADQFVVRRDSTESDSIIAGYHWFNDWGRDAMISLPGLTLATGRLEQARSILSTFQKYLSEGMLPNNFPDAGQTPDYNNSDATLWWAWALKKYAEASGDADFVLAAIPALEEVVDAHVKGTRYNIKVDPEDGLLSGGADGVQLTWMDAKVGDYVVTPRRGKAVEINALWFNFLKTLAELKEFFEQDSSRYEEMAEKTRVGFQKFWNAERKCLYDLINEDGSKDDSVRPNQLLAISLRAGLLTEEREQNVLDVVEAELLTPLGLRSLSPKHKDYKGRYGFGNASANQRDRDETYHQGTVWAWLLGPWIDARMSVFGPTEENVRIINAQLTLLLHSHLPSEAGMGSISEIFDGDLPHKAHGCIAQAWSVAELLRTFSEYPDLQGAARVLQSASA